MINAWFRVFTQPLNKKLVKASCVKRVFTIRLNINAVSKCPGAGLGLKWTGIT